MNSILWHFHVSYEKTNSASFKIEHGGSNQAGSVLHSMEALEGMWIFYVSCESFHHCTFLSLIGKSIAQIKKLVLYELGLGNE